MGKATKHRLNNEEQLAVTMWLHQHQDWCRAQEKWTQIIAKIKEELNIVATSDNLAALGKHKDINVKLGNVQFTPSAWVELDKLKAVVEDIVTRLAKMEGK